MYRNCVFVSMCRSNECVGIVCVYVCVCVGCIRVYLCEAMHMSHYMCSGQRTTLNGEEKVFHCLLLVTLN